MLLAIGNARCYVAMDTCGCVLNVQDVLSTFSQQGADYQREESTIIILSFVHTCINGYVLPEESKNNCFVYMLRY